MPRSWLLASDTAKFMRPTSAPVLTHASARVLVAGRRLTLIERHAELLQRAHERLRARRATRAVARSGAGHEFERRLDLRAVGVGREKLRRRQDRRASPRAGRRSFARKRAAARSTSAGGGVSLTKRRASFVAMKRRRRRMRARGCRAPARRPTRRRLALIAMTEDDLLAGDRAARASKTKPPPCRGFSNRPAGERARHLGDVLLRVAAVDAERVQLHQLAPVVLVETFRRVLARRLRPRHRRRRPPKRGRIGRARVALQHADRSDRRSSSCRDRRASPDSSRSPRADRGTCRARADESSSRSYSVSMKRSGPLRASTLKWLNQKSVEHFLQLPLAVDGAQQLLPGQFGEDAVRRLLLRRPRLLADSHSDRSVPSEVEAVFGRLFLLAPRLERRLLELLRDLARAHADRAERRQPRAHRRIRNPLGDAVADRCSARGPIARTFSTSPGRGPKPIRLST